MGRTRKQPETMSENTTPESEEIVDLPTTKGPQAQPMKIEEKRVSVPKRNLAGRYKALHCVRKDGVKHHPGSELILTDDEARHYLRFSAVEALD